LTNATGLYPRLKVDTTTSGAVGQAGGVLLTETIAASGLGCELSAALRRWRKPLAIHDPAKVITDPRKREASSTGVDWRAAAAGPCQNARLCGGPTRQLSRTGPSVSARIRQRRVDAERSLARR